MSRLKLFILGLEPNNKMKHCFYDLPIGLTIFQYFFKQKKFWEKLSGIVKRMWTWGKEKLTFSVSDFINNSEGLSSELLLWITTGKSICYCACDWQVSISLDTIQMSRVKYRREMMCIKCANSHTYLRGFPFVQQKLFHHLAGRPHIPLHLAFARGNKPDSPPQDRGLPSS